MQIIFMEAAAAAAVVVVVIVAVVVVVIVLVLVLVLVVLVAKAVVNFLKSSAASIHFLFTPRKCWVSNKLHISLVL